jgi:hypothetical protein
VKRGRPVVSFTPWRGVLTVLALVMLLAAFCGFWFWLAILITSP